ncbi:hypothetical protein MMC24_001047 [Lignoscripta atroalba]|nr:hypothetical protein [Lignoscripta atroalba]
MATDSPSHEPPRILVLPDRAGKNALIITLAHPRTSAPTRYYFCPETGIYEFTRVAAPQSCPRSWLIGPSAPGDNGEAELQAPQKKCEIETEQTSEINGIGGLTGNEGERPISKGHVSKTAELLVASPMDPLFLLFPTLSSSTKLDTSRKLFLSFDDHLENLCKVSKHFEWLSSHTLTRLALERRMEVICDLVEAGDEKMYRLNNEKLLKELLIKAEKMISSGLPASMEQKFVRKALEVPVMGVKRQESTFSELSEPLADEISVSGLPTPDSMDSQSSISTSITSASDLSTSTAVTIPDHPTEPAAPEAIVNLLRLRTAISYMISAYVPPPLAADLNTLLASPTSPKDFSSLDEHLSKLTRMRAEAMASRSLSDFSRKRSMNEDDEAAESRAEKKRKKEEEEKRKKAGNSKAVRDLKKVDISGMKKMSDFFGKGAVAKEKKK